MVAFLTFILLISLSVGVFFARGERDYGISLIGWTLAFGCSTVLHFGIEPQVTDTYLFHHDSFRKVTMATSFAAFGAMLVLSCMVTVNTDRDRKAFERQRLERERLREEIGVLRKALAGKKEASQNRSPATIDLERNPE